MGAAWKEPNFCSLTVRILFFHPMLPHTHRRAHNRHTIGTHAQRCTHTKAHTDRHAHTTYQKRHGHCLPQVWQEPQHACRKLRPLLLTVALCPSSMEVSLNSLAPLPKVSWSCCSLPTLCRYLRSRTLSSEPESLLSCCLRVPRAFQLGQFPVSSISKCGLPKKGLHPGWISLKAENAGPCRGRLRLGLKRPACLPHSPGNILPKVEQLDGGERRSLPGPVERLGGPQARGVASFPSHPERPLSTLCFSWSSVPTQGLDSLI